MPEYGDRSGRVTTDGGPDRIETATLVLGPILFAVIVVAGFIAVYWEWRGVTFGDYLQAVAAGAGLIAVGHGIHRSARLHRNQ